MAGRVTVYGRSILRAPLCDDDSASMVVIRDTAGAPLMLLFRIQGDTWGLATPDDPDWDANCIRHGLAPAPSVGSFLAGASH